MSIYRLTGYAESVANREGVAKGTGKPYSIPQCLVRINEMVATEVTLADVLVGTIGQGDMVDLVVDVEKSQSGFIQARATGLWPKDEYKPRRLSTATSATG
jgi:hypothetical protein